MCDFGSDEYNTIENFERLLEKGDIVQCPNCGEYNCYAWIDANMQDGQRLTNADGLLDGNIFYTDNDILTNWPDVYHISCTSAFEWQCGNCQTCWMESDSPLNSECYTHIPYIVEDW